MASGPLGKAASQPRRLALLAVLADAAERGLTRDALIGLLWPEQDAESARHNLTQTLYALRRDLGAESLFKGTSRLALDPASLGCDLWSFRHALRNGDWRGAVDLYRGPFLSGVFVSHTPEFDRWVEQTRQQIEGEYARATGRLAGEAAKRGDHAHAADLWRRLAGFEPHNAGVVADLARQMGAAGDRAGALNVIHEFGVRLREDLALPLDRELILLADAIRLELGHRPAVPASPRLGADQPPISGPSGRETAGGFKGVAVARRRPVPLLIAGILAIAGVWIASVTRGRPTASTPTITAVAVFPFAVHGESATGFLPEGMGRLVTQGLDGVGRVRAAFYPSVGSLLTGAESAADTSIAMATRFHIDRYVAGEVTQARGTIRVRAVLRDASRRGAMLGTAVVTGPRDSLFALAGTIVQRLLGLESAPGSNDLVSKASETTGSLEAFKAFVEGEALFRASRYADAVATYQRAIREDTTFALAYYRLAEALDWNAQGPLIPAVAAAALRFADRLPWRERRLLEGSTAWRDGRNDEAESEFRQITARYPNDAEAWFQLAEVLFHSNSIRGRLFLESEGAFQRVIALDPENRGALTHAGRIRAFLGDSRGADSLFRAAEAMTPGGPDAELALFHAVTIGDAKGRSTALERLSLDNTFPVMNAVHRLIAYGRNFAEADTVLARSLRNGLSVDEANGRRYWLAIVAAAQGQLVRAYQTLDALREDDPGQALELRSFLMTLPYARYSGRDYLATLTALREAGWRRPVTSVVTSKNRIGPLPRWYLLGLLAGRSGNFTTLLQDADSLDKAPRNDEAPSAASLFAAGLRGIRTALVGSPEDALAALAWVPEPREMRGQVVGALLNERFLRGAALERVNRGEEALTVYGSLIFGEPVGALLSVPASLQRARLLVRLGRPAEARRDYQVVIDNWRHADAALQAVVDSARTELAGIP